MNAEGQGSEFLSGSEIIHSFVAGSKFDYKPITCSVIDGLAIFEGDILVGPAEEVRNIATPYDISRGLGIAELDDDITSKGVVISGLRFRWPKKIIPFTIDASLPNKERITSAIKHWEDKTEFHFVKKGSDSNVKHNNFISFEDQGGCFSSVGMRGGGKQIISLGPNCTVGNTIHEIGHSLGLWHEQSREDRDKYVKVIWQNIEQSKWHNFEQHIVDGDDIGLYDYASIMHYPRNAFTKNGKDTIIPLGGQEIGQRGGLSRNDILTIESVYANA